MFKGNYLSDDIKKSPCSNNEIKISSNNTPFQLNVLSMAISLFIFSSRSVLADTTPTIQDINILPNEIIQTMQSINKNDYLDNFENNGSIIPDVDFGVNNSGYILNFINNTNGVISSYAGTSVRNGGVIENFINRGHIGTLLGRDPSRAVTLSKTGTISNFDNQLSGVIDGPTGIRNDGAIGTLNNAGSIIGSEIAIHTQGTISSLINSGSIISDEFSIYLNGMNGIAKIDSFSNSGIIQGDIGIYNDSAKLPEIINDGVISGITYAIYNVGKAGTPTISIQNNGEIVGGIEHTGSGPIIIKGGSKEKPGGFDRNSGATWADHGDKFRYRF
ncbi:hypothetical protein [Serratia sp. JSRIV006]|uniref:hypothetical protein n=1 Tax=Serratia sp. JSRIV006 TaxID=2831896 RepID=UPI001CBF91EE|nr:hypothetical protein [Serratia sp. JSRIV006]UAN62247.1 hypothetical protein KGP16_22200 [Serratia sp. JSRIV006]